MAGADGDSGASDSGLLWGPQRRVEGQCEVRRGQLGARPGPRPGGAAVQGTAPCNGEEQGHVTERGSASLGQASNDRLRRRLCFLPEWWPTPRRPQAKQPELRDRRGGGQWPPGPTLSLSPGGAPERGTGNCTVALPQSPPGEGESLDSACSTFRPQLPGGQGSATKSTPEPLLSCSLLPTLLRAHSPGQREGLAAPEAASTQEPRYGWRWCPPKAHM